ncbi:MAG: TldD/PmbA family protein [Alphaproteobacteria bacterium]|nr:TldD/PmbA family protein [Alphaproteobacteria bacterium]
MATKELESIRATLANALDLMKAQGAEYAEAQFSTAVDRGVNVRLGKVEGIETSKSMEIGLGMRIGDRSQSVQISSRSVQDLSEAVAKLALSLKLKPENSYNRPADMALLSKVRHNRSLDLVDRSKLSIDAMADQAKQAEAVALSVSGVANSDGASSGYGRYLSVGVDSRGVEFISERTSRSLSVSVIAKDGEEQQVGGEWTSATYASDLLLPDAVGRAAGLEAVRALNAGSAPVQGKYPVVFHPDIGASLLGHFSGAINGKAIREKSSFLTDAMGQRVFAPGISVCDDPHLKRGMKSSRFSGEGLPTEYLVLVENGVLKSWLMALESARRLGLENVPQIRGATNLTIEPGVLTPDQLISDIQDGLYVTSLMGQGVDTVSGSYSRAAKGFWIKNGAIDFSHPVDNVSVSSNLKDMFLNMSVANDLRRLRSSKAVPTLRVEGMSIA